MNPITALLGFLFRILLDLDRFVVPRRQQPVNRAQERQPAPMGAWVSAQMEAWMWDWLNCYLPVYTHGAGRRLWVLKHSEVFPYYIILRIFTYRGFPRLLDCIDLPMGYLLGMCLLLSYVVEDFEGLIRSSRAARASSFFPDKFVVLQVFSGVMLSVASPSSLEVFYTLCLGMVWGTAVEMALDIPTPLNLRAMFLSFAYAPLVLSSWRVHLFRTWVSSPYSSFSSALFFSAAAA